MENLEQKTKVSMGKGRPPKHGGYSLMVRAGEIPERMTHIRRYLTDVWDGLIRDVAGREVDLTTAQRSRMALRERQASS